MCTAMWWLGAEREGAQEECEYHLRGSQSEAYLIKAVPMWNCFWTSVSTKQWERPIARNRNVIELLTKAVPFEDTLRF